MYTDEPSVILKLKKGGKVHSKHHEGHGHHSMHHATSGMTHGVKAAFHAEAGKSPKKPSMAERRKAMNPQLYKKGGKVAHKMDGGMMGAAPAAGAQAPAMGGGMNPMAMAALAKMAPAIRAARAAQVRKALAGLQGQGQQMPMAKKGGSIAKHVKALEKELHHHEKLDMDHAHPKHHKHGGIHHKADGGAIDKAETKTTLKNSVKPFVKTKIDDGQHHDKVHGSGEIKEGVPAGYKHGGKVHRVSGHPEGTHAHHKAMAKHHAKMAEGGSAHHAKMCEHHKHMAKMCKGGKYAMGGTIEGNEGKFENTYVVDGDHRDTAHGTGGVKMANAGGFKHGGKAHHGMKHGSRSKKMADGGLSSMGSLSSSSLSGPLMGPNYGNSEPMRPPQRAMDYDARINRKHGGSAKHHKMHHKATGGSIPAASSKNRHEDHLKGDTYEGGNWENRPANTSTAGVKGTKTGEVKEANAGGFKRGGHASKKAYATGGNVVDDGKAVKMPHHFISKPVANSLQSGTFRKGGKVKKFADGSSAQSSSPARPYDPSNDPMLQRMNQAVSDSSAAETKDNEDFRNAMLSLPRNLYNKAMQLKNRYLPSDDGAVTKTKESVTVSPPKSPTPKRKGGKIHRKQLGGWC